jgi:hypothetical protein
MATPLLPPSEIQERERNHRQPSPSTSIHPRVLQLGDGGGCKSDTDCKVTTIDTRERAKPANTRLLPLTRRKGHNKPKSPNGQSERQ